jgi:carbonic anhydrase/acetyltransferase-like protein (isoleucine patch superfamily)
MKIFIHGKGNLKTEIVSFIDENKKLYSKYYDINLSLENKKIKKKIKCEGFVKSDELKNLDIKKMKKYYHLLCTLKHRKEYVNFFNENDLPMVDYLIVNTPYVKRKNKINKGTIIFHSLLGINLEIGKHVYVAPYSILANNVLINDLSVILQRTSIGANVCIGENTVVASNVYINENLKIGNNCYIGPNQIITSNIDDNSYIINGKILKGFK